MSITIGDVRQQFAFLVEECTEMGLIDPATERLVLSEGSKLYGIAYRVNLTGVYNPETGEWSALGSGHYNPPFGNDYVGTTKAEAFEGIQALRRAAFRHAERIRLIDDADKAAKADALDRIAEIMEEHDSWSADTLDEIAQLLIARGFAKDDDAGMFKAVK
jgi:hypothetical protein